MYLRGKRFQTSVMANVRNHRAATVDYQLGNARLRGSGALHCYPEDCAFETTALTNGDPTVSMNASSSR